MKRIFAIFFALMFCAFSFSGCTKNSQGKQSNTDSENSKTISNEKTYYDTHSENRLSNPNATKEAIAVYNYICEVYGTNILSGQQESTWKGSDEYEMDFIFDASGKYPAIRGLDFMNQDFYGCVNRATKWWEKGGIVTICWHCGTDFRDAWDEAQADDFDDWDKVLTEGTEEYEDLIRGMDRGAKALQSLQEKGVPVLWRPFHEFDGTWFWWGKGWTEHFKELWKIMYDRYTNYWGLNNLIWVLGYSGRGDGYEDWYPGDEYVDVVGADSYDGGACKHLFTKVKKVVGDRKPICFHECGQNPTVEELTDSGAKWTWFMTWHTSYLTKYNTPEELNDLYNSDYCITLDELPKFSTNQVNK